MAQDQSLTEQVAQPRVHSKAAHRRDNLLVCADQEEGTYIQQITTIDGQTVQHLMTGDNQVTEVRNVDIFRFHSEHLQTVRTRRANLFWLARCSASNS